MIVLYSATSTISVCSTKQATRLYDDDDDENDDNGCTLVGLPALVDLLERLEQHEGVRDDHPLVDVRPMETRHLT
jgi:hypothetical protein